MKEAKREVYLSEEVKTIYPFKPERERSQWTVRWMRSIRAAIDEVTRITLFAEVETESFDLCLPGEPWTCPKDMVPRSGICEANHQRGKETF